MRDFIASMPERYAQTFDWLTIEQHHRIVRDRAERIVNVGRVTSLHRKGTAICVVAPDRPGLLASISAALAIAELDVLEAEIFTRRVTPTLGEAVDLFWICRRAPCQHIDIEPGDIRRIEMLLAGLLNGTTHQPRARTSAFVRRSTATATSLRFVENAAGGFVTLEIEANLRSGLLLSICQALYSEDVQIAGSVIKSDNGRVRARFDIVELDEGPVDPERRQAIQKAVLSSVDDRDDAFTGTMEH
jgi:[protein-PII] uridylyltransferase